MADLLQEINVKLSEEFKQTVDRAVAEMQAARAALSEERIRAIVRDEVQKSLADAVKRRGWQAVTSWPPAERK